MAYNAGRNLLFLLNSHVNVLEDRDVEQAPVGQFQMGDDRQRQKR